MKQRMLDERTTTPSVATPTKVPKLPQHHDNGEQPMPTTPEEAAYISAQMHEYEAISTRLRAETEDMSQQHPHQWAGMNSDQKLTLADTLPELLAKLRSKGEPQRTLAVLYLDPDPPQMIL